MGKVIQMIPTSEDNSLFILDFNPETNELTFRVSRNPEHKQIQTLTQVGEFLHTQAYNFHMSYLQKFIQENTN